MSLEKDVLRIRRLYRRYLKGKRVALVGPAASILGSRQGSLIDSFDVVIRLKKALTLPSTPELEVDIGKRCDVLYHSMNFNTVCGGWLDLDLVRKKEVKFLMGGYPKIGSGSGSGSGSGVGRGGHGGRLAQLGYREHIGEMYQRCQSGGFQNLGYVDSEWFLKVVQEIGALPNTGTLAILDLLNHEVASLYVTGITFFRGGYIPAYHPRYTEKKITSFIKEVGLHRTDLELAYIRKIFAKDKRVTWYDESKGQGKKKTSLKIQNTLKYREKLKQIRKLR